MLKSLKNDRPILKKTSIFIGYFFQSQRVIHIIEGLHRGECRKKWLKYSTPIHPKDEIKYRYTQT